MKIATWNVNGIRARQAQVHEWIARERPDVVCLQEIKAGSDQVPNALCEMEGYWCYWHGAKGYSGVALHVSQAIAPERPQFSHPAFNYEHRIAAVDLATAVGEMTVASVYVPNGGKDFAAKMRFLDGLDAYAASFLAAGRALVLCGDMNVARSDADVHPKERKPGVIGQRPDERALFEKILAQGVVDVARTLQPDASDIFTWWAPWRSMRERNIGWRIDYVLASESLQRRVKACTVLRDYGTSDHAPLLARFDP